MVDKKGLRHREKRLLWGGVSFVSTFDVVCFDDAKLRIKWVSTKLNRNKWCFMC